MHFLLGLLFLVVSIVSFKHAFDYRVSDTSKVFGFLIGVLCLIGSILNLVFSLIPIIQLIK